MGTLKLTERIYSVGVLNPAMRVFDIIMKTEYGTSYNAYYVEGNNKRALIENVHGGFCDEYLENLSSLTDLKKIDYLIFNHTEPDHSGALKGFLALNPDIEVFGTVGAVKNLAEIVNVKFNAHPVKDNEVLDLGGITLEFMVSPMLHWPDTMFTWCKEEGVLFTCDFLGAHYCEPRMIDTKASYPEKYKQAFKEYYDAIMSPFKPFVLKGLARVEQAAPRMICTSHGPILTESIGEAVESYRAWSTQNTVLNAKKKALILYVSAYGCTHMLAEVLKVELEAQGLDVESYDIMGEDVSKYREKIDTCDALLVGTPTINRDALRPIWEVTTQIDAIINAKKPAMAFGSFGWSGEGVPMILERLRGLKLNVMNEGLTCKLVPSEEDLARAREYAASFAAFVRGV